MKRRSKKSTRSVTRKSTRRPHRKFQGDSLESEMATCDAAERALRKRNGYPGLAPIPWWWP